MLKKNNFFIVGKTQLWVFGSAGRLWIFSPLPITAKPAYWTSPLPTQNVTKNPKLWLLCELCNNWFSIKLSLQGSIVLFYFPAPGTVTFLSVEEALLAIMIMPIMIKTDPDSSWPIMTNHDQSWPIITIWYILKKPECWEGVPCRVPRSTSCTDRPGPAGLASTCRFRHYHSISQFKYIKYLIKTKLD